LLLLLLLTVLVLRRNRHRRRQLAAGVEVVVRGTRSGYRIGGEVR
jgi:Flp pilus assembly protein TadB